MPRVEKQVGGGNHRTVPVASPGSAPSAWDLADKLNVLLFGDSGTGKTTLWG